ncbi:MAG: glutamate--cysteine ligase, partial [Methanobrevibacter sp.]|nr:glutamate--cysteine ligase [Methanobrevibacter sp.]
MDRIFNLSQLHKNASSEDLKQGSFGIEWEGLRVRGNGELSLSPHPEIFGNKLSNPYITTDFSESQIEIITPAFDTIDEAFSFFSFMSDLVNSSLDDDEFLWFQS